MPTTQAFILATTVFPLLAIAKDFPQLDEARLVLADNSAVCYYTNYKFFSPDEESLQLRVRHTNGIQPVEITCPRPEVFEGTFSWPPGLYFDESAFSEDLASLNTTAVELDYIPEYEWERFVSDEDLKTMGEEGVETRARLRAVCAAVREVLQDMFPSFQIFCNFVHLYAVGRFTRGAQNNEAVVRTGMSAMNTRQGRRARARIAVASDSS
ncbi:hypothetical protein FOZ62_010618 [Perkinsus olseni]|uniref:Uncharacterized protein n=1 Tax=Perkinsus olseni TaxID=32597 RepID=A0A7J6PWM6_PEROL|nr:hypothetical protein FOZ62_010618 [Perkinsus olseni]